MKSTTVADISQCLLNKARTEQFAGYDPFDGLNSSWFKRLPISKDSTLGLAWIQLFKRSPINLRPWLGVPKARNPKGVALFILGLIEEYQVTKDPALLTEAEQLAQWLVTQRCDEQIWHGACWGYHFDWKARAFFVPKGKPNVITTVYVSRALHQLGQLTGRADWVDLALRSGDFIAGHLLTQNESGEFLRISPVKRHLYTTPVCGRLHGWLWLAAKRLALITPSWHYALRVTALKLKLPMAVGPMALVIIMDLLTDFIRATT